MKFLAVFALVLVAVSAADDDVCYKDVHSQCKQESNSPTLKDCNARYGAIDQLLPDLQSYANTHIMRSFEYLLMSTHYANYEKNRPGFEKLFREMSDSKWNTGIDLIKYMTKRGGQMDFNRKDGNTENEVYELYEIEAIAKSLDIEKKLAEQAHKIHGEATRRREQLHDPEVSSYIENEFVHKQAGLIRTLSGYITELKQLLSGPDSAIGLYMFDENLK